MGVGASNRNAGALARGHVGGLLAAADPGGAAGGEPAVGALRPSVSELDHRSPRGGVADPCRLGGDEGLEIDDVQQGGFHQLRVQNRTLDPNEWLVREDRAAFRDGGNIQVQSKIRQIAEKALAKQRMVIARAQTGKIGDFVGPESEVQQPLKRGCEARGDGIATLERQTSEEHLKDAFLAGFSSLPVGGGHGELIEIGLQG